MTTCAKIPYLTPGAAKRAAAVIAAHYLKRGMTRVPRGIHPCADCRAWHITSRKVKAALRIDAA